MKTHIKARQRHFCTLLLLWLLPYISPSPFSMQPCCSPAASLQAPWHYCPPFSFDHQTAAVVVKTTLSVDLPPSGPLQRDGKKWTKSLHPYRIPWWKLKIELQWKGQLKCPRSPFLQILRFLHKASFLTSPATYINTYVLIQLQIISPPPTSCFERAGFGEERRKDAQRFQTQYMLSWSFISISYFPQMLNDFKFEDVQLRKPLLLLLHSLSHSFSSFPGENVILSIMPSHHCQEPPGQHSHVLPHAFLHCCRVIIPLVKDFLDLHPQAK